jgi:hypothetical protein
MARHSRPSRTNRASDSYAQHPWQPPYAHPGPGRTAWHTVLAAGRGARAYGRWVARAPETRGLGTALAALYPAGEAIHLASADPLLVGAFAPPAALAAYASTWKAHHSRRYSATVAATAAGIPVWLATAAATGITSLPVLVSYTSASAVTWSAITWSDVLRHRRAHKAQQAKWATIALAAGLEHSRLITADDTRTGQRFRVDVRGTGKTPTQLARGDLAERIAGILALPPERVRVMPDRSHGGVILVTVQTGDPWAAPVTHPALNPAHAPAPRPVTAGPLRLGTDPDTGHDLPLTVYDKGGAWHTFILAATGGGKTTLYSNIAEQATARTDVLMWAIDLRKGTIPFFWGPALDACAGLSPDGTPQYAQALAILDWATRIVKLRSAASGGKNHVPSPSDPAILLLIDEGDTLLGTDSPIAHKAKPLVQDLWRGGRSAGIGVAFAGQRGIVTYTGSKDVHANAGNKIVLRVNRAAEMNNIVPDWEADKMPDMHTYAQGVDGVALVVDPRSQWRAGRIADLSDLDAVAALARRRGQPATTLPPVIATRLPGYTQRHDRTPGAPAQTSQDAAILTLPGQHNQPPGAGGQAGWPAGPHDQNAITRLAHDLVAEVEARLGGMPTPPAAPTSLTDLLAARHAINNAETNDPATNQAIQLPERISGPILGLLADRGDTGARRDEIVAAVGKSRSTVANWLAILRDHGVVAASGAGKAARYYLPEHAPDADSQAQDDDAA